jgi:type I restriction enzyme M protein
MAILSALSERDETAEICRYKTPTPEPIAIPFSESVDEYFDCEVKAHMPDAWIDKTHRDAKDGEVGSVGRN